MSGEGTTTAFSSGLTSNRDSPATALPRFLPTNSPESDRTKTNPSAATPDNGTEEVGTLEWAQVIELQAFSDRKVWIEEKTRVSATHHLFRGFLAGGTESWYCVF